MPLTLRIRPTDARSRPLPVRSRVQVKRNDQLKFDGTCGAGQDVLPVSLLDGQSVYSVALFSAGPFADAAMFVPVRDGDEDREVLCLVRAKRATPDLPAYSALPDALARVLENSHELDLTRKAIEDTARAIEPRTLESRSVGVDRGLPQRTDRAVRAGERRWNALDPESKAGLLNLFAKMRSVTVSSEARTVWSYVERLRNIAPDRVKGKVDAALLPATRGSSAFRPPFEPLPIFHRPDRGFSRAGSWKTLEAFGNLQLSFSTADEDPSHVQVDADIDDAAGIGHAGQVIRNESRGLLKKIFGFLIPGLPDGISHPYDIHQIVVRHQRAADHPSIPGIGDYEPRYRLKVDGVPAPYDI